ncbi:hypothetical protein VTO73DRAFT_818 [Trametes versicolor]
MKLIILATAQSLKSVPDASFKLAIFRMRLIRDSSQQQRGGAKEDRIMIGSKARASDRPKPKGYHESKLGAHAVRPARSRIRKA